VKFDPAAIASQLADVTDGDVKIDVPLAPHSSYKIGGPTSVWAAPATEQAVGRVLELIYR
jgi:UDP-N-acetylenolpyruvoylglucosamine reductase